MSVLKLANYLIYTKIEFLSEKVSYIQENPAIVDNLFITMCI